MTQKLKLPIFISIFLCLVSQTSFASNITLIQRIPIDIKDHRSNFGYILAALNKFKQYIPTIAQKDIAALQLAYTLLGNVWDTAAAAGKDTTDKIVVSTAEQVGGLGLQALKSGAQILGYTLATSNPYTAMVLSATPTVAPFIVPRLIDRYSGALPELRSSYDVYQFINKDLKQETYLSCSYNDPSNARKSFKTWAYEKYLSDDLKSRLTLLKETVTLRGRWIAHNNSYVFGTLRDPLLVAAACIETVAGYAQENNLTLDDPKNVVPSAGNTAVSNSYPVRFFVPTVIADRPKAGPKDKPPTKFKALYLKQ